MMILDLNNCSNNILESSSFCKVQLSLRPQFNNWAESVDRINVHVQYLGNAEESEAIDSDIFTARVLKTSASSNGG